MTWDHTTDLLVIGSGGGGMTAALVAHDCGANVLVLEKSDVYGGSTALSGGALWVPNNHHMPGAGIPDSDSDGLIYLQGVTRGGVPDDRLAAYVSHAKDMVRYLEDHSRVRFAPLPLYPDYYPEQPGGKPGGRSIEPVPYSSRKLGAEAPRLRRSGQGLVLGRMGITAAEAHVLVSGSMRGLWLGFRLMLAYLIKGLLRIRRSRFDTRLTVGCSLMARLRHSLMDRKIPVWLSTGADELVVEDGRVVGAVVTRGEQRIRVRATRGVLLAAGGFARNRAMREEHQRHPITDEWTAASPADQGDAIRMGTAVGATVELMDDAWWTPVTLVPGKGAWLLVVEKSLPGSILVNRDGKRFTNEAAPYIDVVNGMYEANQATPSIPCFLVFDARYRKHYPCGPLGPGKVQPDSRLPRRLRDSGFLKKSSTLRGLAESLGVDPDGLEDTVRTFNEHARAGHDPDFGRGDSLYDRYYSDPRVGSNPNLAPIVDAPFYAIEVYPGDLGTKGGLRTDAQARVLDQHGEAISGLYATGNCSASVMGASYPGAGGTIGPAMAFAYIAAKHAVGRDASAGAPDAERPAA